MMNSETPLRQEYEEYDTERDMTFVDFLANYTEDLIMCGHTEEEALKKAEIMRLEAHMEYGFASRDEK